MLGSEKDGSRKVVLTKWMLIVFSLGTFGYFVLLGLTNTPPHETFFMNFVLGLGAIGGAFTVGNIFEHRSNAAKVISEAEAKKAEAKEGKAIAEAEKAKTEAESSNVCPE